MAAKKKSKKTSEKKSSEKGRVPHEELWESAGKIWLAGLGAMALAEEEGSKFFRKLVERGEEFQDKGRERLDEVRERAEKRWEEIGDNFDKKVAEAMERLGVPTKDEVKELNERLEKLNAKLEEVKRA